jgi:hypothetical protein
LPDGFAFLEARPAGSDEITTAAGGMVKARRDK